ncbi:hypothetical protein TgHK011_002239 [Trichoderma gracile]|nr:hypothetical protein TgHK011_002239 [Trichoderma gracile]
MPRREKRQNKNKFKRENRDRGEESKQVKCLTRLDARSTQYSSQREELLLAIFIYFLFSSASAFRKKLKREEKRKKSSKDDP